MHTLLRVPVEHEFLGTVRAYIASTAKTYHMDAGVSQDLALATGELVELLFRSAFAPGDESIVEIRVMPVAAGLDVSIQDKGLPLDENSWRDALSEIIGRHHLDQVRIVNHGTSGMETRLTKFFQGLHLDEDMRATTVPVTPVQGPIEIRRLRDGDGIQVSCCVYKNYGYSYGASESVYFPDRLEAVNRDGKSISMVAVNSEGTVVGTLGLDRSSAQATLGTAGVVAILPAYHSLGLAERLSTALIQEATESGVTGLEAFAITSNVYSQKLLAKLGFHVQSILLGTPYCHFKEEDKANERETLVGAHLRIQPSLAEDAQILYPPTRHRAMIEVLCQNAGRKPRFETVANDEIGDAKTKLGVYQSPLRNIGKIFVDGYGEDVLEQVRGNLRQLRQQNYSQLSLTLPLWEPATHFMTKKFEKLGFFFAGIQVREAGICLILQYLHGVAIDYDKILTEGDMAAELLSYVRYHDPNGAYTVSESGTIRKKSVGVS